MAKNQGSRLTKTPQIEESDPTLLVETVNPVFTSDTTSPIPMNRTQDEVLRVYRIRYKGIQYLYYVAEGKAEKQGITPIYTYRKYKEWVDQGDGTKTQEWREDRTMITATRPQYDIPFTKEFAKDLVDRCRKDSDDPQFRFVEGQNVVAIYDVENFYNGDFDEVMKKARKGETV